MGKLKLYDVSLYFENVHLKIKAKNKVEARVLAMEKVRSKIQIDKQHTSIEESEKL